MDYFSQPKSRSRDEITPLPATPRSNSPLGLPTPSGQDSASHSHIRPQTQLQPSSIRLRRLPPTPLVPQINVEYVSDTNARDHGEQVGRRRSSSEPQRIRPLTGLLNELERQRTSSSRMPSVREDIAESRVSTPRPSNQDATTPGRVRSASTSARSALGLKRVSSKRRSSLSHPHGEYESGVVDLLDVVGQFRPVFIPNVSCHI